MRVYFPHDAKISMAMERIRQAFIKARPPGVLFYGSLGPNVIHCINWIGQNPEKHTKRCEVCQGVPTLPLTEKYIVFAHIGNPHYQTQDGYYQKLLAGALLVVTYDKRIIGYEGPNIYETPWGYNPHVFYRTPTGKRFKILCTGYLADAEAIDACWEACGRLAKKMVHVGGPLKLNPGGRWYERHHRISDAELRGLYNASEYVSGMRREGGFELPVIEGYACGCHPVVFDHPTMRKYYSDFATFVPNLPRAQLIPHLTRALIHNRDVQPDREILKRFHWRPLMRALWTRIKEAA